MPTMVANQFCWNELATSDVNRAKDFYNKLFGWEFDDLNVGDSYYTVIQSKNQGFGGIWHIPPEQKDQIPPHWMSYVLVPDIAIAVEKARHFGARVMKDITQAGDMGRFAIIVDPTGAHIAFWESSKKQARKAAAKKKGKTKKAATKKKAKAKPKKKTKAAKKAKGKSKKKRR